MSSTTFADARWLCLPAVPASSRRCRDFVRSVFAQWGLDSGVDDALLLVSELCANVVRHAGTPMVVGLERELDTDMVRISVRDESSIMPTVRPERGLEPSGRGLRIVDSVSRRWGVQPLAVGKIVWFELPVTARRTAHVE